MVARQRSLAHGRELHVTIILTALFLHENAISGNCTASQSANQNHCRHHRSNSCHHFISFLFHCIVSSWAYPRPNYSRQSRSSSYLCSLIRSLAVGLSSQGP